jgi:hypothetical protein
VTGGPALRLSLVLLTGVALAIWVTRHPSNGRTWIPEQTVLPKVRFYGSIAHVSHVRDFVYTAAGEFTPGYTKRDYDLNRLTDVWFVLTPFAKSWRGPAHSFLTFGFSDSQFVSISVEARKEPGEHYDPLSGILRRYELMYVIGEERDLIGQRAAFERYPVYLYPIRASPQQIRELFVSMLQRAERLRTHPEFYNTLTSNCTSNVVRHVNQIAPGTIPASWKTVFPGYIDEVGVRLGLIDTRLPVEAARERYRINDAARRWIRDSSFSVRIRVARVESEMKR